VFGLTRISGRYVITVDRAQYRRFHFQNIEVAVMSAAFLFQRIGHVAQA
jgi:hypothetical protein